MVFKEEGIQDHILSENLAPIRYVDDSGQATTAYPFNPNGSPNGIAGLCSADGRHLAMMPHPERCVLPWQWSWMPQTWQENRTRVSPWQLIFNNAHKWVENMN